MAHHGCQRCCVVGKRHGISNAEVFTKFDQPLRTDALFRNMGYPEHQKLLTPLVELPIDTIKDFVVSDPLHLLELGAMKRLLIGWRSGNMACGSWTDKPDGGQILQMTNHMRTIRSPHEINRDARSLVIFAVWKGLEFRNFLCYYGLVVVRHHLTARQFNHFMILFCAVRLAYSEKHARTQVVLIRKLFDEYVKEFKALYGPQFMTINVHNLLHVADDVERFGALSTISAYPFESYLGRLKAIIRAGHNPLQQIARRLIERSNIVNDITAKTIEQPFISMKGTKCSITIPARNFMLCNHRDEDQWYLADGRVTKMVGAHQIDSVCFIEGLQLRSQEDFFSNPLRSSLLNIFHADATYFADQPTTTNVQNITCKFFIVKEEEAENCIFVPILHTEI